MALCYEKNKTRKGEETLASYDVANNGPGVIDLEFNTVFSSDKMSVKEIILEITKTIHGIPNLFKEVDLAHLEIYLGKASIDQIKQRAASHWKNKNTPYFIPIVEVLDSEIDYIERLGLRYLFFLQEFNHLCVGHLINQNEGSNGRKADSKRHIIYLAFRIDQKRRASILPKESIGPAAGYIHYSLLAEFPKKANYQDIHEVMKTINQTSIGSKLYWDIDSRDD